MVISILLKGLIAGITIAVPVGPINIICIQRTLNDGRWKGFASGLGAALADTVYGFIAGFGLTLVSTFIFDNLPVVKLVGGIVILLLGLKMVLAKPKIMRKNPVIDTKSLWRAFTSTFLITLTNPLTIMVFLGIFAGLDLGEHGGSLESSLTLISGVFLGSMLWWLFLSYMINHIRHKFNPRIMLTLNRVSGSVILVFGIIILVTIFI
jgi:threonine/homoserine/homoserine lactone efflux protein